MSILGHHITLIVRLKLKALDTHSTHYISSGMANLVEVRAPSVRTQFPTQRQTSAHSGSSDVTGSTSKLRDSCHSCAVSKIKCPKEKPTCSRCESRGLTCQYFYTKRPGRKRESESNSRRKSTSASSIEPNLASNAQTTDSVRPKHGDSIRAVPSSGKVSTSSFPSRSATSPGGSSGVASHIAMPQSLSIATSPSTGNMFQQDSSETLSVFGENTIFTGFENFGTEIEDTDMDLAMSAMDSPFGLELSGFDTSGIPQTRIDTASLLIPIEGANLCLFDSDPSPDAVLNSAPSKPSSLASNLQAPFSGTLSSRTNEAPSCDCLLESIDLLKSLSKTPASPGVRLSPGCADVTAKSDALGKDSARTVLVENKQSIEAINRMLSCPLCAEDGFFLMVSSMTVLKIVRRYTTAARAQPNRSRAMSDAGSGSAIVPNDLLRPSQSHAYKVHSSNQGGGRTEAQLVLGELHRVQRLVNQLSPKLKGAYENVTQNLGSDLNFGSHTVSGDMMAAALSAGTLKQVENDLRRSLRALSEEIITVLRKR